MYEVSRDVIAVKLYTRLGVRFVMYEVRSGVNDQADE
jgi:hypothetical protein